MHHSTQRSPFPLQTNPNTESLLLSPALLANQKQAAPPTPYLRCMPPSQQTGHWNIHTIGVKVMAMTQVRKQLTVETANTKTFTREWKFGRANSQGPKWISFVITDPAYPAQQVNFSFECP